MYYISTNVGMFSLQVCEDYLSVEMDQNRTKNGVAVESCNLTLCKGTDEQTSTDGRSPFAGIEMSVSAPVRLFSSCFSAGRVLSTKNRTAFHMPKAVGCVPAS